MTLRRAVFAVLLLAPGLPVNAQPPPAPAATAPRAPSPGAMYEFLLARRAEASDDIKAAEAALLRAIALDARSAELQAELAGFYARQNRATEAVSAAQKALALDAESEEGHRILGLVEAAWADGTVDGPAGGSEEAWRASSIAHLQKVQGSPSMATDLGLQITLARQLVAADRAADAVPLLERVVAQTGPSGEPASMLAEALRATGQLERATVVLEQAAAANPRYYMALGDLYERQSKFEDAAEAFARGARAIRNPGRELRLRGVYALLNIPEGKGADRAVTALTEYLAGAPKDAVAYYLLARAQFLRDDVAAGLKAGEQALALEPRHLATLALLAEHHRESYDFAAVAALLAPIAEADADAKTSPGDLVRLLAELGGARQQLGDAAGAVTAFERARAFAPSSAPLATALAQAYLQAGRTGDAARVAREARAAAAGDLGLIRVEALAEVRAGRAGEAILAAESAVGGRRSEVPGAFVLADIYQEAKRHADAIGALAPLAASRPDDDAVAFRLAAAYDAGNRVPDAERTFRLILGRDPLNANALNYLAYMLANRGLKLAEALTLVDRALVVEPDNPAFLDTRGWALFKLGRAADAEAPLRQAATALAGSSVIQWHYAEVLAALGKRVDAAARLEQSLRGDGVDIERPAVEKRLQQLRRSR